MLRKARKIISFVLILTLMGLGVVTPKALAEDVSVKKKADSVSPANLTPQDETQGKELPISLIKGRVTTQSTRYILGPGDVIDIRVKDLSEYDQAFTIRPDGYASIHPFGEYKIDGTDLQGLEEWLEMKFKYYLVKPQITINLKEMRPALIYISGAVRKPGVYQYIRQGQNNSTIRSEQQEKVELTLSNILKRSGGVTVFADINNVKIVRNTTGLEETFSLLDVLNEGNGQDVWLLPGDSIKVPMMDFPMSPDTFSLISKSTFFDGKLPVVVLGAVTTQGQVLVDPQNNSLNTAISLAGGYSRKGKKTRVIVQRPTTNGGYSQMEVHPLKAQFNMLPGDIVYVAESKKAKLEYALKMLSGVALPVFFGTSALNNVHSLLGTTSVQNGTDKDGDSFSLKSKSNGLFDSNK